MLLLGDGYKVLIHIKDNFFNDPDKIRKIGLSQHYSVQNRTDHKTQGWEGYRRRIFKERHGNQEIDDPSYSEFLESCVNYTIKSFNCSSSITKIDAFFHVTDETTGSMIKDWIHVKYHKDVGMNYAGLVYLSPNPTKKSGTSIVDYVNEKIIHVENVYNRLVCYPAYYTHAVDSFFGNGIETGRMTLTFFIQTSS